MGQIGRIEFVVELPMLDVETFERLVIDAPKGVLLSGPPGSGKTPLCGEWQTAPTTPFSASLAASCVDKHFGQSEKREHCQFDMGGEEELHRPL